MLLITWPQYLSKDIRKSRYTINLIIMKYNIFDKYQDVGTAVISI